jgi:hypothetical protein
MSTIILLQDLIDQKRRKEKEIVQYQEHLKALKVKLDYLRREIALTERIISMVKKEEIIEIRNTDDAERQ